MMIVDAPSPNFGPRQEGKKIKYLILHYTGTETSFEALRLLQGGRAGHDVSAHYLVDENGLVTRLVDEAMRAWHAGKSSWEGEEDINSCSIGIEIQNPGHEFGYVNFPEAQMQAVAELCRGIIARQRILPYHVLAHSDIAPERKQDPGELFPWAALAEQGIGLWPESTEMDADDADAEDIKHILTKYGYDRRLDEKTLLTAFQRHFEPEVFGTPERIGVASPNTVQLLQALLRQKQALRPRLS
ncbi:MAG: N-acetylmuramoyl-L-alanine amidase [Alphaproteobacteria bacterium]|nr:N-acetylmuramoyl-L-alanine amidase [Alphaproteobacteria bacterium]